MIFGTLTTAACGSGEEAQAVAADASVDAGRPASDAGAVDATARDASAADARTPTDARGQEDGCVPGARALDQVDFDASSSADGGLNRECIRCVVSGCVAEFDQCMNECVCNAIASELVRCLETSGQLLVCGAPAQSSSNATVQAVVACASQQPQCLGVCGL